MVFRIKVFNLWVIGICLALLLGIMIYLGLKTETVKNLPVSEKVLVLDAGHGGMDGGANLKDGTMEKNINLSITKYLKEYLEQSGAKVIMTREKDISLHENITDTIKNKKRADLLKRREIANTSGADAFISIHINYFEQEKYKGAQVFYETKNSQSIDLAKSIQDSMVNLLDKNNKRTIAKIADNKILYNDLKIPSVLVECGFLSNNDEAKLLKTKEYQQKVAYSIYLGIMDYFTK